MKVSIKPAAGFSGAIHILLQVLLPALVFVFARLRFFELATALILLAKWRMFAVKPRHWLANIRANAVDIIVGMSLLIFMIHSGSQIMQLLWAVLYCLWLIFLKPRSNQLGVVAQAYAAEALGLLALFVHWGDAPIYGLVIGAWVVCYAAARHFFSAFDEPLNRFLAGVWGYTAAALVWLLSHWLLFYGLVSQPTLILLIVSFGVSSMYYLEKTDRLSIMLRRQILFVVIALVGIIMLFSNWGDKTI